MAAIKKRLTSQETARRRDDAIMKVFYGVMTAGQAAAQLGVSIKTY
jgi:hypothetical protein